MNSELDLLLDEGDVDAILMGKKTQYPDAAIRLTEQMAQEFIKMGYYIGVGGIVKFKNAKKLKETVEAIPLERILLETDCPYMTPEPHRGTRNDSSNIPFVIAKIAELKGNGIELHQVEFSYGEKTGEVLHGINLSIQPGTVNALVGPSGSGKSTLAKLIAGFWNVTGGSITLGGTDIRKIPFEQLNGQIAYVSQENYLFDRSIRIISVWGIRMQRMKKWKQLHVSQDATVSFVH